MQFFGLMGEVGVHQVSDVLPSVTERFAPLFLGDHVVALCVPSSARSSVAAPTSKAGWWQVAVNVTGLACSSRHDAAKIIEQRRCNLWRPRMSILEFARKEYFWRAF